jgi:sigma-B regulation protein RsbU (phosphoserine phosphatase)
VVDEKAMTRQLRIRHVRRGEGVLAQVWEEQNPQVLGHDDPRLEAARRAGAVCGHVVVMPLCYSGRTFGVLVLARPPEDEPFSNGDMQVFLTLAEQSAFTLRTAEVFSDAAEKRRLDSDLEVAHEIQRILLPSQPPDFDGFEICGLNVPARHVSGDYYDFLAVDENHCGVVIADVSGKGVPASLIMATCRGVLRGEVEGELSAAELLRRVNHRMFPDIKEDMFISMAYLILERNASKVTMCRAGHDAPFLYRASDRSVTRLNPPGMAVGIDSGAAFNRVSRDFSLELESGDFVVLYTDGVTEATDMEGEEFGVPRVTQVLLENAHLSADKLLERVTNELKSFVGTAPQHDDITLIVIRKK